MHFVRSCGSTILLQTKCTFGAISGWNPTLHSRVGRLFSCLAFLLYYVVLRSSQRWRQTCTQSIASSTDTPGFPNAPQFQADHRLCTGFSDAPKLQADHLILSQPGGTDYAPAPLLAPSDFQTFLRPQIVLNLMKISSLLAGQRGHHCKSQLGSNNSSDNDHSVIFSQ